MDWCHHFRLDWSALINRLTDDVHDTAKCFANQGLSQLGHERGLLLRPSRWSELCSVQDAAQLREQGGCHYCLFPARSRWTARRRLQIQRQVIFAAAFFAGARFLAGAFFFTAAFAIGSSSSFMALRPLYISKPYYSMSE